MRENGPALAILLFVIAVVTVLFIVMYVRRNP
jgi:hypothetical protein